MDRHPGSSEYQKNNFLSAEDREAYEAEKVRQLYRHAPAGLLATAINSIILVFIQRMVTPANVLALWLVSVLVIAFVRYVAIVKFRNLPQKLSRTAYWKRSFIAGAFLSGMAWGSAAIFLFPPGSLAHQTFLAFVIGGMVAGAAGTYSIIRKAFFAYSVPAVLPIIVRFGLLHDEFHMAMATMAVVYVLTMIFIAKQVNTATSTSLMLSFEKNGLVSHLSGLNEDLLAEVRERKRAEAELQEHRRHLEEVIEERTRELLESNVKLQTEAAERRHAEEEVRKLNYDLERRASELESAYRDMESFSYAASHDLKAPIHRIKGFAEVLWRESSGRLDENGRDSLNRIAANANKMRQLVEDLLAFSSISAKELQRSEVHMDALLKSTYDEVRDTGELRDIRLVVKKLPPAYGDSSLLRQVLLNLLSNAVKFTRTRETALIEVGCETGDNENIYYVKDNGIGFDMQFADKLFGLFQRIHISKDIEGTGVGLVIVKKIIEKHGGRVWAEGRPEQGAIFYFSLPAWQSS